MKIVSQVLLLALFIQGICCCFRHYDPTVQYELSPFKKRHVVESEGAAIRVRRDLGNVDSASVAEDMDEVDEDQILALKSPGSEEIRVMRDGSFIYKGYPYNGVCLPNIFLEPGAVAPKFENCQQYLEVLDATEFYTTMRTLTCDENNVFNASSGECVEVSEVPSDCYQKCEFKIGDIARSVVLITPEGRFTYQTLGNDGEDSDSGDYSLGSVGEEELEVGEDIESAVAEGMDVGL